MPAAIIGIRRKLNQIARGVSPFGGYDVDMDTWATDIEGAICELAVAKVSHRYWDFSVDKFKGGADVPPDIEVRWVSDKGNKRKRLIIRSNDRDDYKYVLVIGSCGNYEIIGWILGKEGKKSGSNEAPNGRPPCWFVDQSSLHDFRELVIE